MRTRGDMLSFAIAFAPRGARKLVRRLRHELTEERYRVANDVVHRLKQHGDPWRLSEDLPPPGKAHSTHNRVGKSMTLGAYSWVSPGAKREKVIQRARRINIARPELIGHQFFRVWSYFKEVEMRKHVLVLTTTVAFLAYGAITASAQAPVAQSPATQQSPTTQPIPGGSMMQHVQRGEEEDSDDPVGGMTGMMGRGYGHHGCHGGHGMVGMRIIFSLMDADGDGTVSLQEFQAAQERIFRAMDADHDGTVSLEEMQDFMRGVRGPPSHQ